MPRRARKRLSGKDKLIELGWLLLQMTGVFLLSWINATRFDKTELYFLGEAAAFIALLKPLRAFFMT
mgnify:CR=1 FL=1